MESQPDHGSTNGIVPGSEPAEFDPQSPKTPMTLRDLKEFVELGPGGAGLTAPEVDGQGLPPVAPSAQ